MFETTTILASDRLCRWGRIFAVSAIMLGPWFTLTAQADVTTQDIRTVLIRVVPPLGISEFSQDLAVKQVLQRLVRKPDGSFDTLYATKLGFDLPPANLVEAAVQQASSSIPIALFRIGLKRLQQFNPGDPVRDDPLKLLAADANWRINPTLPQRPVPARFIFPITVKDPSTSAEVVQSSVRLHANWSPGNLTPPKLDFEIERFGSSNLIRLIDKWRRDPNPPRDIKLDYFLVWVPALDRYYLGRLDTTQSLQITAITNDPQVGLKGGEEADARKVFEKLKVEALTIDAVDPDAPPR